MLATLICNDCGDAVSVSNRSITLPFVCEKCQAAIEKFQDDIAPANAVLDTPSKETVDTAVFISDLSQQLNETTVERNELREKNIQQANDIDLLNFCLDAEEHRVVAKETQIANQAGTIKRLEAQNTLTTSYAVNLGKELMYAAKRVFTLAAENGKLKAELKLVTEERETAYASELALHKKLSDYIDALNDQKNETRDAKEHFIREYKGKIDQWLQKKELQEKLEHPWRNLWNFYQDKVR